MAHYELQDGQTIAVRAKTADLLELEAVWEPATGRPLAHFHPSQDEHFEVLEGELTVELDGEPRTLRAGDALDIPRGTVHGMWNAGESRARASWQVRPALRTEEFFAAVHAIRRGERAGDDLLQEFAAEFRLPS